MRRAFHNSQLAVPGLSLEAVEQSFQGANEPESLLEAIEWQPSLDETRLAALAERATPTESDNPTARELRSRFRQLVDRLGREADGDEDEADRLRIARDDGHFEVVVRHGPREERLRLTGKNALEHEIRQELWIGGSHAVMSFREQFSPPPEDRPEVVLHYRACSRSGSESARFRAVVVRADGSTEVTTNENGRVESYVEDPWL